MVSDSTGAKLADSEVVFAPFGEIRAGSQSDLTDFGYTGQRSDVSSGLMYYGARYYLPKLRRFISAIEMIAFQSASRSKCTQVLRAIASKLREDLKKKVFIESGLITFLAETSTGRITLEEVESNVAQHREVLRGVVLADARFIFAKGDIQHPVQGVFDGTMVTGSVQELARIGG